MGMVVGFWRYLSTNSRWLSINEMSLENEVSNTKWTPRSFKKAVTLLATWRGESRYLAASEARVCGDTETTSTLTSSSLPSYVKERSRDIHFPPNKLTNEKGGRRN